MAGLEDASLQFAVLAQRLRYAADRGLRDELSKAVDDAARPVVAGIRAELKPLLPDRYAGTLDADLALPVSKRTAGSEPGVRITGRTRSGKGRKLRRVDAGLLTHPLYGNREHWYTQEEPSVRPGFFTGPARRAGPVAREKILGAMRRVSDQITGH